MTEKERNIQYTDNTGNDFITDVSGSSLPLKIERVIVVAAQR